MLNSSGSRSVTLFTSADNANEKINITTPIAILYPYNPAFLFVKAMTSGGPNGASEVSLSYMYGQKDAGLIVEIIKNVNVVRILVQINGIVI